MGRSLGQQGAIQCYPDNQKVLSVLFNVVAKLQQGKITEKQAKVGKRHISSSHWRRKKPQVNEKVETLPGN
jgi:hypothetical protein